MAPWLSAALLAVSFIAHAELASAQHPRPASATRSVSGVVEDQSGGLVPKAEVTITDASGQRTVATTDGDGHFVAAASVDGPFVIAVVVPGFAPTVRTDVDGSQPLVLTVSPAAVQEHVTVVSESPRGGITASATRTATPLLQVPQTVDVVDAGVLREQAAVSLGDALRNIPAVNANLGEGRRDQFLIRGFSALSDTLLDGTRDDAPYFRDVATVERIEVVKGPAAALFGRGSSGGVINRVLKAPRPGDPISDATLSIGSLGTRRVTADIGRALGGALSFRTAAAAERSTSFRDDFFLNRVTAAPSLLWTGTATTALAQVEVLSDRRLPDRGIPSVNGRPADVRIGQGYGYAPDDFIAADVVSGSVRVERRTASGVLLREVVRLGTYDTSFSNTAPASASRAGDTWRITRQQYNAEQSQQNLFSQSEAIVSRTVAGIDHVLLGGIELGVQRRSTIRFNGSAGAVDLVSPVLTRPSYSATAATYNQFVGSTAAVYAQDQLSLGRRWKALIGARGDRYAQSLDDRRPDNIDLARTDVDWSPRAGVVFQPTRQSSLYATVSRSFQPSGEGLSLAVNAAELEPEVSRNIEAGAKADLFERRASATVSVFQLDRTNIKTTDPIDPTRLVLVGRQRTRGLEVAFEGQLAPKLRAQAGYAFLDAAVLRSNTVTSGVRIEGNRPGLVPRHGGSLWLHYAATSRLSAGGGLSASGVRYTSNDNLVPLPAYTRADAMISYRLGRTELTVNVRNVLGVRYYETAASNFQIFPGTPRDVVFSVGVLR